MNDQDITTVLSDFSRLYMLILLYEEPCHGYNIMRKFKNAVGKEISPSMVYPFLRQLEQKGFVKHSIKAVGTKKRKIFELTEEGKKLCRRLFKRFSMLVAAAIEPNVEVCANCGCKVYEGGYKEVVQGKKMSFCCIHCALAYKAEHGLA